MKNLEENSDANNLKEYDEVIEQKLIPCLS